MHPYAFEILVRLFVISTQQEKQGERTTRILLSEDRRFINTSGRQCWSRTEVVLARQSISPHPSWSSATLQHILYTDTVFLTQPTWISMLHSSSPRGVLTDWCERKHTACLDKLQDKRWLLRHTLKYFFNLPNQNKRQVYQAAMRFHLVVHKFSECTYIHNQFRQGGR